jgi:hypothetical protein
MPDREEAIRDAVVAAFEADGYTVGGEVQDWPTEIAGAPTVLTKIQKPSTLASDDLFLVTIAIAERLDKAGLRQITRAAGLSENRRWLEEQKGWKAFTRYLGAAALPVVISPSVGQDVARRVQWPWFNPAGTFVVAPAIVDTTVNRVYYASGARVKLGPGAIIRVPLSRIIQRNVAAALPAA